MVCLINNVTGVHTASGINRSDRLWQAAAKRAAQELHITAMAEEEGHLK
jgi:hypothetical protein